MSSFGRRHTHQVARALPVRAGNAAHQMRQLWLGVRRRHWGHASRV